MISFERGRNPKETLEIGLAQKIPEWMEKNNKDGYYTHKNFMDVWNWALEFEEYDIVFPYMVSLNGEDWYGVRVEMDAFANELLWESVAKNNLKAVKAILTIPDLFPEEAMTRDFGTTEIKEINPDTGNPYRTALFGNIIELAKTKGYVDLIDPLVNYYHEEYNRFRKREKS